MRTAFLRTRGSSDQWTLFENRVDLTHGTSYSDCKIETVTFLCSHEYIYMASFAADGRNPQFHQDPKDSMGSFGTPL